MTSDEVKTERYTLYMVNGLEKPRAHLCKADEFDNEMHLTSYADVEELLEDIGEHILVDSHIFHKHKNK